VFKLLKKLLSQAARSEGPEEGHTKLCLNRSLRSHASG
jgi:hypothetical protein